MPCLRASKGGGRLLVSAWACGQSSDSSAAGDSANPLPVLHEGSRSQLTLTGDPENVLLGV